MRQQLHKISTEAIFNTLVIYAYEGWYIGIFDVTGAYLYSEMPREKQVLLTMREDFIDMVCEFNPEN